MRRAWQLPGPFVLGIILPMKIAVLASDEESSLICAAVAAEGHACVALSAPVLDASVEQWDLLIAALSLLPGDGAAAVTALRKQGPAPILLLANAADETALTAACEAGAQDYVLRPLRRAELALRTQVLLRRAWPNHPTWLPLHFPPYAFDLHTRTAMRNAQPIALTRKEFELALLLFQHLDRPLSRATMLELLWPEEVESISRTLDTHVSRVRNKLGLHQASGYRLVPVYNFGYCLESVSRPAPAGTIAD